METGIYIIAIGLLVFASFCLGMYVTTQISEWINNNKRK